MLHDVYQPEALMANTVWPKHGSHLQFTLALNDGADTAKFSHISTDMPPTYIFFGPLGHIKLACAINKLQVSTLAQFRPIYRPNWELTLVRGVIPTFSREKYAAL